MPCSPAGNVSYFVFLPAIFQIPSVLYSIFSITKLNLPMVRPPRSHAPPRPHVRVECGAPPPPPVPGPSEGRWGEGGTEGAAGPGIGHKAEGTLCPPRVPWGGAALEGWPRFGKRFGSGWRRWLRRRCCRNGLELDGCGGSVTGRCCFSFSGGGGCP